MPLRGMVNFAGMTNFALIVTQVPRGKEGLPEKTVTDA